ncbi:MAG: PEGA domain-containing protein [Patescibacteria group bacterium]|nr:PEGA domain-containing protein [Patescibacteria group bacterium]
MRRIFLLLLPIFLAVIVFFAVIFILSATSTKKGALQVTSVPQSTVYLDGNMIGKTPLCKCDGDNMLAIGEYTIKLVPVDTTRSPFEEKISINTSVLTVVDRTFGDIGKSSGSIISLIPSNSIKTAQLSVVAIPYGASVSMDNNAVGIAPLLLQSITDSDHEVTIAKDGYTPKTIRIHGVVGYTLKAVITLAADNLSASNGSSSGALTPLVATASATDKPQVVILQTPTGFLRVRSSPSLGGDEIAQVHPGETYTYLDEQTGWLEIQLQNGKQGWVSDQYAKKQ